MSKYIKRFKECDAQEIEMLGGKGGSLARLIQAGFPVPDGFVILPTAFVVDDAARDDELRPEAWSEVVEAVNRHKDKDGAIAFAVRSSALSEDSVEASFAGEFETVLNVRDDADIYQAIKRVQRSRHGERVRAYSQARGLDDEHAVAVIVQQLVPAEVSGVLFTANPISGDLDQAMITATWGLGEAIVAGLVTPDTLIVAKESGQVLQRETGDKQVMTVLLAQETEERPVPQEKRGAAVLTDAQAAELVALGSQIEDLYGMPMDIEWTMAGGELAIVQARPVTTLAPSKGMEAVEWRLPEGSYMAVRNNIVELMADPLTPLFGTMGLSAVNTSLTRLMAHFFGRSDLMPPNLIISVNDYAYYNGSWSFGQMMRILLRSVSITRRMFSGAVERWTEEGRPRYVAVVDTWQSVDWQALPAGELLDAARELAEAAIDAYGAMVGGVIPAAWISEGIFTAVYGKLMQRAGDPAAAIYLMGYDSKPIQAEKSLYDLAVWAKDRPGLADYLASTAAVSLADQLHGQPPAGVENADWLEWLKRFHDHLNQYGHAIYNLDFSNPVPADDPAVLLETIKLFLDGQGVNPYTRQEAAAQRRAAAEAAMLARLKGLRLKMFCKAIAPAQRYAPLREDSLADVGLAYPLLRQMLLELGRRFVNGGMIGAEAHIFWLTEEEVMVGVNHLDQGLSLADLSHVIPERRAAWHAARNITPPLALPQRKFFGLDIQKMKAQRAKKGQGDTIRGVAAAAGSVTGTACVVQGPEDFAKMKTGDILIAAITTPAWTPLFARAAAVVTDVGGPLSHGSIVAREYGIPAVLGTGEATKRIRTGQRVHVDGGAGTVEIVI